ncbi:MAG: PP2C family protein-serine/threonine phosphatase [Planctomycetota bacterium]
MQRLGCGAVWSGTVDDDVDMCSRGLCASLFSRASEGGSGGDVYFMTVCGGDRLTRIAIADVAGHGRRVNAVGEWLLAAMKRHMNDHDAPGLLRELNRAAMKYGARAISTVAVVAWDAVRHRLEVASAGHPDVLVSRRGGDFESVPFASRGGQANLPLAVLDNPEFDQVELELEPGDRVAVYSDGVLDLPGSGGSASAFAGSARPSTPHGASRSSPRSRRSSIACGSSAAASCTTTTSPWPSSRSTP